MAQLAHSGTAGMVEMERTARPPQQPAAENGPRASNRITQAATTRATARAAVMVAEEEVALAVRFGSPTRVPTSNRAAAVLVEGEADAAELAEALAKPEAAHMAWCFKTRTASK